VRDTAKKGGKKGKILCFEGSQALPASPSSKVKFKFMRSWCYGALARNLNI
jgi:hypothetical protein